MATYQESEYPTIINTGGNGNNGFGWGGDGIWALLAIAILFGNNGFGGGFGGFGRGFGGFGLGNEFLGYQLGRTASQEDVASGFNNSAVLSGINGIKENQLSMQNFINQGFAGINSQLIGEFRNVDNSICTLGYQQAQLVNNLSHQLSDCCCQTSRAIDNINFNNAKNTCDIIQAINYGNQKVIDYMQNEKIDTLNRKLAVAENRALTYENNAYLINQIKPCPIPAFITCNPNTGLTYPSGYTNVNPANYGNNCCGCGF